MLTVASAAIYRIPPPLHCGFAPFREEMARELRLKKYTVYKKATENYFIPLILSRRKYSNYFMMFIGPLAAKYKTLLHFFPFDPPATEFFYCLTESRRACYLATDNPNVISELGVFTHEKQPLDATFPAGS
jgi:hypothetical protein